MKCRCAVALFCSTIEAIFQQGRIVQEFLPYVWSYVVVGVLLSLTALVRGRAITKWNSVDSLIVFLLAFLIAVGWPMFVIWFPDILFERERHAASTIPSDEHAKWKQRLAISANDSAELSDKERSHIALVAANGESSTTFFSQQENFANMLDLFWEEQVPPEAYLTLEAARARLRDHDDSFVSVLYRRETPEWYVGFSSEFVKSIAKLDKNKRARVLEAIAKLADAPLTTHGDTVKPLTGNLAGLWRYRIGDDRLIYKPNALSKQVVLLSFASRGGVYEHAS